MLKQHWKQGDWFEIDDNFYSRVLLQLKTKTSLQLRPYSAFNKVRNFTFILCENTSSDEISLNYGIEKSGNVLVFF